ncbi:hypothetical protein BDV96DRAFT_565167 [Lophiotrema nucula]|uniref:F-box domain-containing protein n=1 Tax=Lophiotrema nucula TaxID=690887 RepID=A0A6A5ZMI4_9PLEO|nr:hypothetical protein BDV96DRAFT_565167 [Lophiotrema nucula]
MALTGLPTELLEQIFHSLESIDDVHHLARSCQATYHAIRQHSVYVEVMRSVISQSIVHRFDLQLCYLLDLHREVVKHFEKSGNLLPQTR